LDKNTYRLNRGLRLTIKDGVVNTVDCVLAFSKVFVMPVFMVKVLGEPTRRTADFLAGRNWTWPAWHEEQVSASVREAIVLREGAEFAWNSFKLAIGQTGGGRETETVTQIIGGYSRREKMITGRDAAEREGQTWVQNERDRARLGCSDRDEWMI
jgi:hypothetical protein